MGALGRLKSRIGTKTKLLGLSRKAVKGGALSIYGAPGLATVGVPFSFVPVISGGKGAKTITLNGSLLPGLSFSTTTGAVTGTATGTGTSLFSISVTDDTGTATLAALSITAAAALGPLTASYLSSAAAGTVIASITGLAPGENIVSFLPNDGRLVVASNQIVKGLSASSQGVINATLTTNFGRTLSTTLTVGTVGLTTLALQSVGSKTLANVPVNPLDRLDAGASITAGNEAGHFALTNGSLTVTAAGDAADLNAGPYSFTIAGDPIYKTVQLGVETSGIWYTATTGAEIEAAIANSPVGSFAKVEIPDGVTINPRLPTDLSQTFTQLTIPAKAYTSTLNDGIGSFTGTTDDIEAAIIANGKTAKASYDNGGSVEITCRTPFAAMIDQKVALPFGTRGLAFTNLSFIATSPVTVYVPTLTAKFLPNQVPGFSGGFTPSENECGATIGGAGVLAGLTIAAAGSGGISGTYNAVISGGSGGAGAAATYTVAGGVITAVNVTNRGYGYKTIPTVTLDPASGLTGASLTASLGYFGGSGYVAGETAYWSDGVDSIEISLLVTGGVITGGTITSKTAGVEDKIDGPIVLANSATGNGIRTAAGVGGVIVLTHNNYAYGPPPGGSTYQLLNNANVLNIFEVQTTGGSYPAGFNDLILRNCEMGGYRTRPNKPGQWVNVIGGALRYCRNVVIEDCRLNGFRNGLNIGMAKNLHMRRNDIQRNYEDAIRMFSPSSWASIGQMATGGTDDFANGGKWSTAHAYFNDIHNNITDIAFQNLHSDGFQIGTFADTFGYRGVVYENRIVMPYGSTQGLYVDDAVNAMDGIQLLVRNNLIICSAQNALVAFRGNADKPSRYINNTILQSVSSPLANTATGGAIVRRGNGTGYVILNNIVGSFWNDSGAPYASTSITAAGAGYLSTDKVVATNNFGVTGYGTLIVDGNGGITGVNWTVEPTGFGSVAGLTITATSPLSAYTLVVPAAGILSIFSNTGTNGKIKINAGATSNVYNTANGVVNFGYGVNAGSATLTDNVFTRPYTENTGAGDSFPEVFTGPFTRLDEGATGYLRRGWLFADVDHTPGNFRAAIDAIFSAKAGSAAVGHGHRSTLAAVPVGITGVPAAATVGAPYTFTPVVTNGSGTKTFALTSGSLAGTGLSLNTATGTLSGTIPSAMTISGLVLTVTDSTGSASLNLAAITATVLVIPKPSTIRADGWSADYATAAPTTIDPVSAPVTLSLSRQGFDTLAQAATITEPMLVTSRVRKPFPDHATLEDTRVSLEDFIYSTDTGTNLVNNSILTSPKPVARWALSDKRLVGNSVRLEVVAAHRNARNKEEIACVRYTATDGTLSVSTVVSSSTILGHPGDLNPVIGYAADLDISTLATGQITVTAEVFPWIGNSASVRSMTATYLKNTALLAAPPLATVDPVNGNDTTGVVSTTQANADAAPFLTINGALNKANTAYSNAPNGLNILIKAGGASMTASVTATGSNTSEVVVRRHPSTARADAVVNFGSVNVNSRQPAMRYTDLSIVRTGSSGYLSAAGQTVLELVSVNNGAFAGSIWGSSTQIGFVIGCDWTGGASDNFGVTARELRLARGLSLKAPGAVAMQVELGCVIGSVFENAAMSTSPTIRPVANVFAGFNKFMKIQGAFAGPGTLAGDLDGVAFIQNVMEFSSATSGNIFRISGDNGLANTNHVIMHHNTHAGADGWGRHALGFDENTTDTVRRSHTLWSSVGEVVVQMNTKGDLFVGTAQSPTRPAEAPNRLGNWPIMYGIGFRGQLVQYPCGDTFANGTGTSFGQAYSGVDSINALASNVIDPKFVAPAATTINPTTAGVGNGNYQLQAGSPAIGKVKKPVLKFDLAGVARGSTTATGAYVQSAGA